MCCIAPAAYAAEEDSPSRGAYAAAKYDISKCVIALENREYTGKGMLARGTIIHNGIALTKDVDYTFSNYKNNKLPGTATVTITGTGNYTGSIIAEYEIVRSAGNNLALPGKWESTSKGLRYLYDHNGKYAAGRWLQDLSTGKLYRMSAEGYALKGVQKVDDKIYGFDAKNCFAKTGWVTFDGAKYYFQKDYTAATGWMVSSDGRKYRFAATGKLWRNALIKVDGSRYYATKDGSLAVGRKLIKGKRYVFNAKTFKAMSGLFEYKGKTYYAGDDFVLQYGWKFLDEGSYYFTKTGPAAENVCKKKSDGTWWYMDSTGRHDRDAGAKSLLAYAKKLVDKKTPYLLGGNLKKGNGGTDCSGFSYYCYKHLGVTLGRMSDDQQYDGRIVAKDKASVALAKAKPGDIIITGYKTLTSTKTSHVMIYAGKNSNGDHMAYDEAGVYNKKGKLVGARYDKVYNMGVKTSSIICIRRMLT